MDIVKLHCRMSGSTHITVCVPRDRIYKGLDTIARYYYPENPHYFIEPCEVGPDLCIAWGNPAPGGFVEWAALVHVS